MELIDVTKEARKCFEIAERTSDSSKFWRLTSIDMILDEQHPNRWVYEMVLRAQGGVGLADDHIYGFVVDALDIIEEECGAWEKEDVERIIEDGRERIQADELTHELLQYLASNAWRMVLLGYKRTSDDSRTDSTSAVRGAYRSL